MISAAPPSDRIAFQPAIEMPRNRNCTSSQRTSGAWVICFRSSAVLAPLVVAAQVGEALEDLRLDARMIDADGSGNRDPECGKQHEQPARDGA